MTGLKTLTILFMFALTSLALNNALARSGSSGTGTSSSATDRSDRDTRAGTQDMSATPGTAASAANDRSVVIRFPKGQAALSQEDQNKLRNLISSIGADNIERIEVASWSDHAFPRTGSDLPKPDRDLAEQRASRIHDFLKSQENISGMRIKKFNMAETSNWLARTMRTEDAELKSVFAKEGTTPVNRADFNYIMKEGAPSEAVVVVVRK